jgi:lysine 2,3-aminomutase
MYCRHCQRRRNFDQKDTHASMANLVLALDYVRSNTEIRDVLITGGDALMLSNSVLDWLLMNWIIWNMWKLKDWEPEPR